MCPALTDIKLSLFGTDCAFQYLIKRWRSKNSSFFMRLIRIDEPAAFSRVSSTFLFVNSAFMILFFRPKQIRSIESHSLFSGFWVFLLFPEMILALEQFQRIFIICDGQLTFTLRVIKHTRLVIKWHIYQKLTIQKIDQRPVDNYRA